MYWFTTSYKCNLQPFKFKSTGCFSKRIVYYLCNAGYTERKKRESPGNRRILTS